MKKKTVQVLPLNRVEGDLKIYLEFDGNVITDAKSSGAMYRGFENLMIGRGALDGLVITPRVCGVCSTAHLYAAARALDEIYQVRAPDNARRISSICLMAEMFQSDIRHAALLINADFTTPVFKDHPLYEEAVRRYAPLKGSSALQVVRESKKILEIIALLGGQWPHSSFLVPGGVISAPTASDIVHCRLLMGYYRKWYETFVLGCSIEEWAAITSLSQLEAWLSASEKHRDAETGFLIRFARKAGLDEIGKGPGRYISAGVLEMPDQSKITSPEKAAHYLPGGFWDNGTREDFDQQHITEDIFHAWFEGETVSHPFKGETRPYATGNEKGKYSWAKSPRYSGLVAEAGPIAQMMTAKIPLFLDLAEKTGSNVLVRQLARLTRAAYLLPAAEAWLEELSNDPNHYLVKYEAADAGSGCGLVEAPRGTLGHWVVIRNNRIERYQIITPTTWNASPADQHHAKGPCENALMGTVVRDLANPVEAGIIIRSFDPCLVCTVHAVNPLVFE